ncbi:MAG: hypothetical protein WD360_05895 [Nitriliruptoraceae bacterium]
MNVSMLRLLSLPLAILVAITAGAYWLDRVAPELDLDVVVDVPPPALADVPRCMGENDSAVATAIGNQFPESGRVTSSQLLNCPRAFDQKTVTFTGEVVGELIMRRGGVWAHVNDDPYALIYGPLVGHSAHVGFNSGVAVWFPDGTHEIIETVGRHAIRGDVVKIVGTFLRADPNDGGGLTLRADSVSVLAEGFTVDEPLHTLQLVVAAVLLAGALAALGLAQFVRRRR